MSKASLALYIVLRVIASVLGVIVIFAAIIAPFEWSSSHEGRSLLLKVLGLVWALIYGISLLCPFRRIVRSMMYYPIFAIFFIWVGSSVYQWVIKYIFIKSRAPLEVGLFLLLGPMAAFASLAMARKLQGPNPSG